MRYVKNYCEEKEISTSKLNEAQKTLYYIAENMKMDKSINEKGYKHFQMAIKALEQTTWIPVNERLSEEDTAVLIWCPERRNIYCAYLEEKQWWIFGAYFQKVSLEVIAWMPLPEPYKAESEE